MSGEPLDGVAVAARLALQIDAITIFPGIFESTFRYGVVARAFAKGTAQLRTLDLREFATDRHRTVDDRPFGGGEGMVLKPEPLAAALSTLPLQPKAARDTARERVVLLSAQGKRFTQARARQYAELERLVLICGRYEGVDERVNQLFCDEELCIGDYVLSGGELAAAVVIDAVVRLLPGVLGNADSTLYESFGQGQNSVPADSGVSSSAAAGGLLDYPHYTRPPHFSDLPVPPVLLSGDHHTIQQWRRQQALLKTYQNRPDLLEGLSLSDADRRFLAGLEHTAVRQ